MGNVTSVVIVGGGPGGYEAALVGRQLGADVTLIDSAGIGGSAVLTDCVPSKALITTANVIRAAADSAELGVLIDGQAPHRNLVGVDLTAVNHRIKYLAAAQSIDIQARLESDGITIVRAHGRLDGHTRVIAEYLEGGEQSFDADVVLLATGARPRILESAEPDGERILNWEQIYDLTEVPESLIVVGSGVTGAEFAGAFQALGSHVTLVSSRDRVLPGEDPDAAKVVEDVYSSMGMHLLPRARAVSATRTSAGAIVTLDDGRTIEGTHVLMAVGSLPNTERLNLEGAGVEVDDRGFIKVDRVSRTSRRGVYAAGDCTGLLMLASVAAMQGRIAMWHALGDAVQPIELGHVSRTVFTSPEIATVGLTQHDLEDGSFRGDLVMVDLHPNARAKMEGLQHGFVKLYCRRGSRIIAGAVIASPHASELIHPLTIAVEQRLTADQLASTFTVYPSLSGTIAEAARRLHVAAE
jgi:NAD(P)H dehydrogenase (quinone)